MLRKKSTQVVEKSCCGCHESFHERGSHAPDWVARQVGRAMAAPGYGLGVLEVRPGGV